MTLIQRRKLTNLMALGLSLLAMGFGLFWLGWILLTVLQQGLAGLSINLFTQMTPPPGAADGGLLNALVGSVLMVSLATMVGTPIGILAGIYLAEYGQKSWLGSATRYVNDLLLSAPSIVIGLFVWTLVVSRMQTYSGWAGIAALSLIVVPVVVRTTENMLLLVPDSLREAAFALGAPKYKVTTSVVLRAARSGVITGILLAVARIGGETAPLLFTSLSSQFWSMDLGQPIASLPVMISQFAMSPFPEWQQIAWAGVLITTLGVLMLNILARTYFRQKN
ncbi:MAG: phosphate ABC transporter, permease protein PstA [Candidatus Dactylopiibacterium carminicum]|uniref:Phosphate transport system permease protein PstA n=1 Tax=Candidatus Dactylopiibacterium carminicum TaxID=857335 RepID=A0A272ET16_9RHOO|nr:phosphate ABC transporter permease PstA [Candidatus Dactylopiibacterium carminicum]KAF7599190.1 phosphate ABC transporter, permease protein PstA [Candidatus Dactylopiibacterium carminicum]PAS93239.1 MAG: phosphate ABC transporter, permease protein PstA [Candidatus Dactylopiibacterium carminicum]PAS97126.1 MAG: phosphate ABC transporter, permease protein PstA [Candidatus Dactylopiibacterium carminicum]PAS99201.1 MAG: phosphate ABC transporter, permease protein PstA [Candidatus Dactylopiibacte